MPTSGLGLADSLKKLLPRHCDAVAYGRLLKCQAAITLAFTSCSVAVVDLQNPGVTCHHQHPVYLHPNQLASQIAMLDVYV